MVVPRHDLKKTLVRIVCLLTEPFGEKKFSNVTIDKKFALNLDEEVKIPPPDIAAPKPIVRKTSERNSKDFKKK